MTYICYVSLISNTNHINDHTCSFLFLKNYKRFLFIYFFASIICKLITFSSKILSYDKLKKSGFYIIYLTRS